MKEENDNIFISFIKSIGLLFKDNRNILNFFKGKEENVIKNIEEIKLKIIENISCRERPFNIKFDDESIKN